MLFDVLGLIDEQSAQSIAFAIHALDPQARLTATPERGRLRIDSRLGEREVADALRAAGYPAFPAPEHPAGTTCCGSCG
ncbi:MAG TPA: hypothetical protein VLM17_09390 [Xanthomonadaceae bacterium]|nr:hypothetical protein [Xanthomonadaceae bacterium]